MENVCMPIAAPLSKASRCFASAFAFAFRVAAGHRDLFTAGRALTHQVISVRPADSAVAALAAINPLATGKDRLDILHDPAAWAVKGADPGPHSQGNAFLGPFVWPESMLFPAVQVRCRRLRFPAFQIKVVTHNRLFKSLMKLATSLGCLFFSHHSLNSAPSL